MSLDTQQAIKEPRRGQGGTHAYSGSRDAYYAGQTHHRPLARSSTCGAAHRDGCEPRAAQVQAARGEEGARGRPHRYERSLEAARKVRSSSTSHRAMHGAPAALPYGHLGHVVRGWRSPRSSGVALGLAARALRAAGVERHGGPRPRRGRVLYRMAEESTDDWAAALPFLFWSPPLRTFQKRSVSSAAAEQMVVPSGLCAMCSTRLVWPVSSATRTIEGYFHRMSWLCE